MTATFFDNSIERRPSWVTFSLCHLTELTKSILLLLTGSDFVPRHPWTTDGEGQNISGEDIHSRCSPVPLDFSWMEAHSEILHLLFRVYYSTSVSYSTLRVISCRGESIFHLTLPLWLSIEPFREDLPSTDWNIISCWTSTLELLRRAPCNFLTTALSYLLVTQRPQE